MTDVMSDLDLLFLIKRYCAQFPDGRLIPPPRNAGCYHHDYSDDWERLVQLKLIKQEDTVGWTYLHRLTDKGRKLIINTINGK